MLELNRSGEIKIGDNFYSVTGLSNNCKKLFLSKTDQRSIYIGEHKRTEITRNISKAGTIRLDGRTINVLTCDNMKFHIDNALTNKAK